MSQDGGGNADDKGKGGWYRRVAPPNPLHKKVRNNPAAPTIDDAAQRGQSRVTQLANEFLGQFHRIVTELRSLPGADGRAAVDAATRQQVFDKCHELRGEAGTYGYPLATLIADSLCKVMRNKRLSGERAGQLFHLHLQALERVLSERIEGDGGATGEEFRALIKQMEDYHG